MVKTLDSGVSFDGIHSYYDYGWILVKQPKISYPEPRLLKIDIAGRDGSIDITETALGGITYKDRKIKFNFRAVTDDGTEQIESISRFMHDSYARKKRIILDEDNEYYYYGRCTIDNSSIKRNGKYIDFTITADCEPYKRELVPVECIAQLASYTHDSQRFTITDYVKPDSRLGYCNELLFGTKTEPTGMFSKYHTLNLTWSGHRVNNTYAYVEYLNNGSVSSQRVTAPVGQNYLSLPRLDNVFRILLNGVESNDTSIKLEAYAYITGKTEILMGDNHAMPIIKATYDDIYMIINGKWILLDNDEKLYEDIDFTGGKNVDVAFSANSISSGSPGAPVKITFDRGWL